MEADLEDWFGKHPTGLVLTQGSRASSEWLHNGYCLNRVQKHLTVIRDLDYTSVDGFQISHAEVQYTLKVWMST